MTEPQPTIVLLADEFKREARTLKKRYRTIETDIQTLIDRLKNGDRPGDQVPGLPDYLIYKVRVKNSDMKRGKSGGYRVIYQNLDPTVILLRIYSKSDQDNISLDEIRSTVKTFQTDNESI